MKKIATTVRCVPRCGFEFASVRTVELDLPEGWDDDNLRVILTQFFAYRSIADAVYAIDADDDGFFAIVNDEAYHHQWGDEVF